MRDRSQCQSFNWIQMAARRSLATDIHELLAAKTCPPKMRAAVTKPTTPMLCDFLAPSPSRSR